MEAEVQKSKKPHLSLALKTAVMIVLIAVLFTTALVFANYNYYKEKSFEYYKTNATNIAKTTAMMVDGNKIGTYLDTGFPDLYYDQVLGMLQMIKLENDITYIYIERVEPEQGRLRYIMTADVDSGINLGDETPILDEYIGMDVEELMLMPYVSETDEYGWLCSVMAPIYDDSGEYVADVGVDISMNLVRTHMHQMLFYTILLAAGIAVIMIVLAVILMKWRIVSPITKLSSAAAYYDSGLMLDNLQSELSRLQVHTGDEIEELTLSVQKMERDIKHYVGDLTAATAANERISAELNIAANIQAAMLPSVFPAFPDRRDFDLYATMHPAKEVGGDFYDYFLLDYDHLAFIAADVSGKGVPAALFMVVAKTLIRNQALFGLPPEKVFSKVNMQLCDNNKGEMFVTAWMGVLELSTGKVSFANAGHTRPVIARKDGSCEYVKSRAGFVLAGMEMMQYKLGELQLMPGDILYLYTDGVTEATNAENQLYGEDRLLETVQQNPSANPKEMIEKVKESIDEFVKDAPQFDDITMLAVQYKGDGSGAYTETKTFIAAKEELDHVLAWLDALLEKYNCPPKAQMQLDVAVEEIFINVASYAYPQGTSTVNLTCHFSGSPATLEITFADKGVPYDPMKKKDPDVTLSAEERGVGGLGIFMVKKTMDDMRYRYENGQNILTIVKKLG